ISSCRPSSQAAAPSAIAHLLSDDQLADYEQNVDHAALITNMDEGWFERGRKLYRTACFNCHGDPNQQGSMPQAHRFWQDSFRLGSDPYSMYQTITRGAGAMPAQVHLVPREKYDVIRYVREVYLPGDSLAKSVSPAYIAALPIGDTLGPAAGSWQPWRDADYGNFLMYTYEIADSTAPRKVISGGRAPLANEDYGDVNFAYKGIAMRLDEGPGGVSDGTAFAVFDQDLLRLAGFWTGNGFIDWDGILLNDRHNIYPRTAGHLHASSPVAPGWADPTSGTWEDPRFTAVDGRQFGPLPQSWARYKGLHYAEGISVIHYAVGAAQVFEKYSLLQHDPPVFMRQVQIKNVRNPLTMRLWSSAVPTQIKGADVRLQARQDQWEVTIAPGADIRLDIVCSPSAEAISSWVDSKGKEEDLSNRDAGDAHYPERLTSNLVPGNEEDPYAVDVISLPLTSPWLAQFRASGIDFLKDPDEAVVCTVDGDVFIVSGITQHQGVLTWQRIASGLFQPLGIKVIDEQIYVSCRDQIVRLHDQNGDRETDYYECFNGDHQVTEHFHEFAMGLQVDEAGNLYYAKSGRHARRSLVPQHGTLIKVSPDGKTSEILASGFRAANGVCINEDGSFFVTDQEGYWLPMNRINRVLPGEGKFYGNMWGFNPPKDSSDEAMERPLLWVDSRYDRSPAELVWAKSQKWGPLSGGLLSLSYGYGKIYHVMPDHSGSIEQGSLVELPIKQFPTGIMRGRFHPEDGQLYACGMMAWATSQVMQAGGIYRIRHTGADLNLPVECHYLPDRIRLVFSSAVHPSTTRDQFEVNTWQLKRSKRYGSKRHDTKQLSIASIEWNADRKSVDLLIPNLIPSWIVEIKYDLNDAKNNSFSGAIQGSIFSLDGKELESI
ncbi:MAG: c-type cytochrome, partial [Saprospiraceae bacterium]|nr:c-type cytochrome [Saprospiraceae bacterium]